MRFGDRAEFVLMILQQVFCRVIALTPKLFFSKKSWYNIVDFVVVILAFAASIATYIMIATIDKRFKMVRKNNNN